jgi:hypothetical protein
LPQIAERAEAWTLHVPAAEDEPGAANERSVSRTSAVSGWSEATFSLQLGFLNDGNSLDEPPSLGELNIPGVKRCNILRLPPFGRTSVNPPSLIPASSVS